MLIISHVNFDNTHTHIGREIDTYIYTKISIYVQTFADDL